MKLLDIKEDDYDFIFSLTSDKKIMQYIVDGKVWSEEKTKRFINYNLEEQKLNYKKRNQFYYIISDNEQDIGIIAFFQERDENYYLRIFIAQKFQGQGYFSKALEIVKELLIKYKGVDKLYAEVHKNNYKMDQILKSKYFYDLSRTIGRKEVNRYIIFLRKYTYLVKSDYINQKVIDNFFKARGNWIKFSVGKYPDYLRLDGKHYGDPSNRKYRAILKNIVNDKKKLLTVKSQLYKNLGNKGYFPNTFIFDHPQQLERIEKKLISEDRAWIFKPDNGFAGEGIVISRKKDFPKIDLNSNKKFKRWSLQEYIENPMLIEGKKFHLRVLFLYRANSDYKKAGNSFWFKNIPIYLARKNFVYDNFEDEEIHISHYSEEQEALYLQDLNFTRKQLTSILMQLKIIMLDLANNLKANCYKGDCLRCYEMFGVDLMLTDDMELKLIEFNSKIGLKEFTKDPYKFNQNLLQAELEVAVDYFFPPQNKNQKKFCDFVLIK